MKEDKIQKIKKIFLKNIPQKLLNALKDYDNFTVQSVPNDFKSFGAYHSACKSSLSHILLLMKLLQTIDMDKTQSPSDEWLFKAQKAVSQTEEEYENI